MRVPTGLISGGNGSCGHRMRGASCAVQAHGSWYGSGRTGPGSSYFFRESESGTRTKYGHQHSSTSGLNPFSLFTFSLYFSPFLTPHPVHCSILTSLFPLSLFSFTIKFLTISPCFVRTPLASIQFVTTFFLRCLVIYNTYRSRTGPIFVGIF